MTTNNTFNNQNREENNTFCNLTEQWKKGELDGAYYIKNGDGGYEVRIFQDKRKDYRFIGSPISEFVCEVPSYEEWQSLNELLDSMQDTNKVLAHKLNNIKVNGNYPDRISKLKSKIKSLTEELEPFTDPYFKGLTTKHISELAKKSIRLTKQSCDDNTTIQRLKELLCYCADVLEEMDDKDRDIEILLEEVNEVLK